MNHFYRVNRYTNARYCTETDLFKQLPELDPKPDPDLVVKFPDPAKKVRIRNTGDSFLSAGHNAARTCLSAAKNNIF
jgi:hypothetical protein